VSAAHAPAAAGAPSGFWPRVLSPLVAIVGALLIGLLAGGLAAAAGVGDQGVGAIAITGSSGGMVLVALLLLRSFPDRERRLMVGRRGPLAGVLGLGAAAGLASVVVQGIVAGIASEIDPSTSDELERLSDELSRTGDGIWQTALIVTSLVVLAPLGEELLFRGILLRTLVRRLAFTPAALVTSAVFALVHLDQYVPYPLWPRTLGLAATGLILAWIYRARGYWAAVSAHATVNGIAALALLTT
jgi:hypothetical protein